MEITALTACEKAGDYLGTARTEFTIQRLTQSPAAYYVEFSLPQQGHTQLVLCVSRNTGACSRIYLPAEEGYAAVEDMAKAAEVPLEDVFPAERQ